MVGEQKLLKVNHGHPSPVSVQSANQMIERLGALLPEHDALVTTDFGYGLFGAGLADAIPTLAEAAGKPYFADVSAAGQANILKFRRPKLVTPTETELRFAMADMESGLSVVASRYLRQSGADEIVVTLDRKGCISFAPSQESGKRLRAAYLPALGKITVDSVGAGDLFLAGVVLGSLSGVKTPVAAYLGSSLAAIGVIRMGNVVSDLPRLLEFLGQRRELAS